MGKLLTILGADEDVQQVLPADLFQAEKVIVGLQEIYSNAPESPKKNQLALAISEAVRLLMARLNPFLVKEKEEEQIKKEEKKLPDEKEAPRVRKEQPKPPMPPEIPETPEEEEPKAPKKEKPQKPQAPEPPTPSPHKKVEEEPMTCEEIKDAIKGLNLIAKMGDSEAKEIVKILKNKYKTQNCK